MDEDFQSDFVFGLQGKRYQEFIDSIARPIIEKVVENDNYEIIAYKHHLSYKDFQNTKISIFPNFYTSFLVDITKTDYEINFKTKVCISFDEKLCNETCLKTGRKITAIELAGRKIIYFIFFDIREFFAFVYDEPYNLINKEPIPKIENDILPNTALNIKSSINIDTKGFIKKYGFIHNINYDDYNRKFAFVWLKPEDGLPLFYEYYRNLNDFHEGDFLGMYFRENERYPDYIEIAENQEEIAGFVKRFTGELVFPNEKNYAFINTKEGTAIFVKSRLAEDFLNSNHTIVRCVAIFNENKWRAEYIENYF